MVPLSNARHKAVWSSHVAPHRVNSVIAG